MCPLVWLSLHGVCPAGAALALLLGVLLGALLQLGDVLVRSAVGLDGLLAVRCQLGLPVALAVLLLGQRVLLVLFVVFDVCGQARSVSEGTEEQDEGGKCKGIDAPPEDSFMRLTDDTAKLRRSMGVEAADGRRATAGRKSLEAMVSVVVRLRSGVMRAPVPV